MATISPQPKLQFFTTAGTPLTGGKLYTYLAGTTTPLSTYADSTGVPVNTNPIILDSRGECSVWFSTYSCKMTLKDATGVELWTVDHIEPTATQQDVTTQIDAAKAAIYAAFAASGGSALVGYQPMGGTATTVQAKLREHVSIKDFGATGTGTENAAVTAAEASTATYIDLDGLTVTTTLLDSTLTKHYYNGTLYTNSSINNKEYSKPISPSIDYEVQRPRSKSPLVSWIGVNVLWLGTSLPHYGGYVDSYPVLFGAQLGCNVVNNAWSGSRAIYNVAGSPSSITTVICLSMTEDDRLAGLALYGGSSAYSDTFDPITKPSAMTCDFRIKTAFAATQFDCVMLDHNINDSMQPLGTLTPETLAITGISKGVTTSVTVSSIGTIAVGDAVSLTVTGIAKLNYASARVQSVSSNTFVLNIDSSAFAGSFASGSCMKLDRNSIYGAYEFVIRYIYWSAVLAGVPQPKIVTSSCPSNYMYGAYDSGYWSVGRAIKQVADKYNESFFDINYLYDVNLNQQTTYFPDTVHPSTLVTRQALVNYWTEWATGGSPIVLNPNNFLPTKTVSFTDQREALYTNFTGGFSTPNYVVGPNVNVLSQDFSSGAYATWTAEGTAPAPTVVTAPWSGAAKALYCTSTALLTGSGIYKTGVYDNGVDCQFDIYLPVVTGLVSAGSLGTINIMYLKNNTSFGFYTVQLIASNTDVVVRLAYFTNPNDTGLAYAPLISTPLAVNTKYTVRFRAIKAGTGYLGAALLYLNGTLITRAIDIPNATQTTPGEAHIGVLSSNTSGNFNAYFGNVVLDKMVTVDYSTRYTGSFVAGAKTITVVNGIITTVV